LIWCIPCIPKTGSKHIHNLQIICILVISQSTKKSLLPQNHSTVPATSVTNQSLFPFNTIYYYLDFLFSFKKWACSGYYMCIFFIIKLETFPFTLARAFRPLSFNAVPSKAREIGNILNEWSDIDSLIEWESERGIFDYLEVDWLQCLSLYL
jgi:hypothetical protein